MKISVVIPCLNEEISIGKVIQAIPENIHEIIVVDNGSTDDTAKIARNLNARVVTEMRKGYGSALKAGFLAATGDIIATLDGDGQYPAYRIPALANTLEAKHIDFISGNRFPLENLSSLGLIRRFGNSFLTHATNLLFGLNLKDSQSGMWIFRKSVLEILAIQSNEMSLSEEIKIKAAIHPDIRFEEIHIGYDPRLGDSKLLPLKHGFLNLKHLFTIHKTISSQLENTAPHVLMRAQLLTFVMIGAINTILDLVIYTLLTRTIPFFSAHLVTAKILSFTIGSVSSFFLNRTWTFRKIDAVKLSEVVRFYTIVLSGLLVNAATMYFLTHVTLVFDLFAAVGATAASFLWNFVFYKFWVFKKKLELDKK